MIRSVLLIACFVAPALADKPSKAEIAKKGKAATAIVQTHPGAVAGTAFCVHAGGYFATAEGVLAGRPDDAEITLVLDLDSKTQKVSKARIVRRDRELGLALLRVDGTKDLAPLPLGKTDQVSELAELVVLGFPGGSRLAEKDPEYPSVVVDVATVTSVSKKNGDPSAIRMKAATPTTAGGPLLADDGAVVGVVLASRRGDFRAVPVNRLAEFLAAPDVRFTAPAVTRADQHRPVAFEARAVSAIPPANPPSLELILRAGNGPERRLPMTLADGVYRVSAVPVAPEDERRLEVTAHFETGAVTGLVADRGIVVGTRKLRLSACARIQKPPRPAVTLADGKTIEGVPTGLGKVAFLVGGQIVTFDLSRATAVEVVAPAPILAVECTVVVRQGAKEVGRSSGRIAVRGVDLLAPADLTGLAIVPPKLAADKVVKNLPEIASDVRVGGGGRYLVLHLPKLKKLAVFDVNEAAIVRYIPLAEDKVVYAAGLDKVVVGLCKRGVVERWDLGTGVKELSRAVPGAADVDRVVLGSASRGPVLVNGDFLDLGTLRPLPIKSPHGLPAPWSPVSADGTALRRVEAQPVAGREYDAGPRGGRAEAHRRRRRRPRRARPRRPRGLHGVGGCGPISCRRCAARRSSRPTASRPSRGTSTWR